MLKRTLYYVIAICVVYTILTVTSSTLYLIRGEEFASHLHLINRFIITTIGIGSFAIYDALKRKFKHFALIIDYPIIMGLVFSYVWFTGLFVELHPDAYRDIFWNFTVVYLIITIIFFLYCYLIKKATSNS